jgi:hypothetical protein
MKTRSIYNHSSIPALALGLVLGSPLLISQLAAQTPAAPPDPTVKHSTRVRTKLDGFELSPNSGKSPNQVGGASRDIGTPKLFAPNSAKAFTTSPYFQWAAAEPDGKVTFKLSTADGQLVYETTTTADHLKYPSDAPPLTPGSSYRWTILPENDILSGAPTSVVFQVVSGAERAQIKNELKSASDPAAVAGVFVNHRVWYDSVQAYSDLIERTPNDENARVARAELYDQLPVTKSLADADWRMVH